MIVRQRELMTVMPAAEKHVEKELFLRLSRPIGRKTYDGVGVCVDEWMNEERRSGRNDGGVKRCRAGFEATDETRL